MRTSEKQKHEKIYAFMMDNPDVPVSIVAANTGVKKSDVRKFMAAEEEAKKKAEEDHVNAPSQTAEKEEGKGTHFICSSNDIREKLSIPSTLLDLYVLLGLENGDLRDDCCKDNEGVQFFTAKGLLYIFVKSQSTKYGELLELLTGADRGREEKLRDLERQNAILSEKAERLERAVAEAERKERETAKTLDAIRVLLGTPASSVKKEGAAAAIASAPSERKAPEEKTSEHEEPAAEDADGPGEEWITVNAYCKEHKDLTPYIVRQRISEGDVPFKRSPEGWYYVKRDAVVSRKYKKKETTSADEFIKLKKKGWLTTAEAASILSVSVATLLKKCSTGDLPSVKTTHGYLIDPKGLEKEAARLKSRASRASGRLLPSLTEEEAEFKKTAADLLKKKAGELGIPANSVLHIVYRVMRDKYGYVFEQKKKDYISRWGLDESTKLSTLHVIIAGEDAMCREVFMSVLHDVKDYVREARTTA